jgi:hypothetical protein
MNCHIHQILDQLQTKATVSVLEPYADVVSELRRKRYSYRLIAIFLAEHLNLSVHWTTIHAFVRRRYRACSLFVPRAAAQPSHQPVCHKPEAGLYAFYLESGTYVYLSPKGNPR